YHRRDTRPGFRRYPLDEISVEEETAMTRNGSNGKRNGAAGGPAHPRLGIPELGGVCTYAEAARPGIGVEENVRLLKRYNWVETRLVDLFLAHVTATPEWEAKGASSLHAWLAAVQVKMRQPRVLGP